jgi:hypothetical protein
MPYKPFKLDTDSNHATDIRLSTLNKAAEAFGKKLQIALE